MLRSGFFNSKNHDRQYYTSDISYLFNSLIKDGVFSHIGDKFIARAGSGMQVVIPSGLAWFNSTWTVNDSDYVVNINEAPYIANYKRIDGIFLQVFPEDDIATRDNAIYYMPGTHTSGTPAKPVPTPSGNEIYVPLCYVTVSYNDTAITNANIENMVGKTETPFVTGILETIDITELLAQWEAQWQEWLDAQPGEFEAWRDQQEQIFETWSTQQRTSFETWRTNEQDTFETWRTNEQDTFDTWFENIQYILDGDVAGHLQNEINDIISGAIIEASEFDDPVNTTGDEELND